MQITKVGSGEYDRFARGIKKGLTEQQGLYLNIDQEAILEAAEKHSS